MARAHKTQRAKTEADHDAEILQLNQEHSVRIGKKTKEINQLVGRPLVIQDGDTAWPDNKTKIKYQALEQMITATSPNKNKKLTLPKDSELG